MEQAVDRRDDETQQIQMAMSISILKSLPRTHPHSESYSTDQKYKPYSIKVTSIRICPSRSSIIFKDITERDESERTT